MSRPLIGPADLRGPPQRRGEAALGRGRRRVPGPEAALAVRSLWPLFFMGGWTSPYGTEWPRDPRPTFDNTRRCFAESDDPRPGGPPGVFLRSCFQWCLLAVQHRGALDVLRRSCSRSECAFIKTAEKPLCPSALGRVHDWRYFDGAPPSARPGDSIVGLVASVPPSPPPTPRAACPTDFVSALEHCFGPQID